MRDVGSILFVCHGNICRSPMAEFVAKDIASRRGVADRFEIASCATSTEEIGKDTYLPVKRELERRGVPYTHRKARRFTQADYDDYDLIVVMDCWNMDSIMRYTDDDPKDKVRMMTSFLGMSTDVDDPWFTGLFSETFDLIHSACEAMFDSILDDP